MAVSTKSAILKSLVTARPNSYNESVAWRCMTNTGAGAEHPPPRALDTYDQRKLNTRSGAKVIRLHQGQAGSALGHEATSLDKTRRMGGDSNDPNALPKPTVYHRFCRRKVLYEVTKSLPKAEGFVAMYLPRGPRTPPLWCVALPPGQPAVPKTKIIVTMTLDEVLRVMASESEPRVDEQAYLDLTPEELESALLTRAGSAVRHGTGWATGLGGVPTGPESGGRTKQHPRVTTAQMSTRIEGAAVQLRRGVVQPFISAVRPTGVTAGSGGIGIDARAGQQVHNSRCNGHYPGQYAPAPRAQRRKRERADGAGETSVASRIVGMETSIADHFPAVQDGPAVQAGRGGTGIGRPGSRLTLSPGPDTILGPDTRPKPGDAAYFGGDGPEYMGDLEFVAPVRSAPSYDDRLHTPLVGL
mmetsp:Transcript_18545/g.48899  ORF Transcript_18545/g.48899 Transcript_18545/m.48899 type:complete len:414 (+) Transcript_18545:130-1371(+)